MNKLVFYLKQLAPVFDRYHDHRPSLHHEYLSLLIRGYQDFLLAANCAFDGALQIWLGAGFGSHSDQSTYAFAIEPKVLGVGTADHELLVLR
mgnify:CR=1 FL=1